MRKITNLLEEAEASPIKTSKIKPNLDREESVADNSAEAHTYYVKYPLCTPTGWFLKCCERRTSKSEIADHLGVGISIYFK